MCAKEDVFLKYQKISERSLKMQEGVGRFNPPVSH